MTSEKIYEIFKGILALGNIWGQADEVRMLDSI